MKADMQSSVEKIRTRLLILLGRAFIIVLLFVLFIFIGVVGYFITSTGSPFQIKVCRAIILVTAVGRAWKGSLTWTIV
jgi:hypothetical protein